VSVRVSVTFRVSLVAFFTLNLYAFYLLQVYVFPDIIYTTLCSRVVKFDFFAEPVFDLSKPVRNPLFELVVAKPCMQTGRHRSSEAVCLSERLICGRDCSDCEVGHTADFATCDHCPAVMLKYVGDARQPSSMGAQPRSINSVIAGTEARLDQRRGLVA